MITITYLTLQNQAFGSAIEKLSTFSGYKKMQTAYHISKISTCLGEEFRLMEHLHKVLAKKYAELDEKGELIPVKEHGEGAFKLKTEEKENYFNALKDFMATEVKITWPKLSLEDIDGAPLSPVEITALEPFLTDLEPK